MVRGDNVIFSTPEIKIKSELFFAILCEVSTISLMRLIILQKSKILG